MRSALAVCAPPFGPRPGGALTESAPLRPDFHRIFLPTEKGAGRYALEVRVKLKGVWIGREPTRPDEVDGISRFGSQARPSFTLPGADLNPREQHVRFCDAEQYRDPSGRVSSPVSCPFASADPAFLSLSMPPPLGLRRSPTRRRDIRLMDVQFTSRHIQAAAPTAPHDHLDVRVDLQVAAQGGPPRRRPLCFRRPARGAGAGWRRARRGLLAVASEADRAREGA